MQITPNNKLASLGTVGLLFLAGIAGMVFLLPASPVHAASPTVTLSVTSAKVGATITLTGSGFASGASVAISSVLGTATVTWLTAGTCTTTNGGTGTADSLDVDSAGSTCLTTNAAGAFETMVKVPALTGGPQTISVTDGVSTATTTLTIIASIAIYYTTTTTAFTSGYPEATQSVDIKLTGFGALDSITLTGTTAFSGFPTSTTATSTGSFTYTGTVLTVLDTTGGSKSISATGSSTLTASTTFTILPWVAFYNTQTGGTTFSFFGTAPTSLYVAGHGFANTAVAANSITISGVATSHSGFTPDSTGQFGVGSNNHLLLSPTANVPFGLTSVVIQGNTFSFAAGNIQQGIAISATPVLGGALVSSITSGGTGIASLNSSSFAFGGEVAVFGYGYTAAKAITISTANLPGLTITAKAGTTQVSTSNTYGAFFETTTAGTLTDIGAGTYTVAVADGGFDSSISPSYTVTPTVSLSFTDYGVPFYTAINYMSTGLTLAVHGFSTAATSVTVTAGGATLATMTPTSCATLATNGGCTAVAVTTPDLASQEWVATASDGTNSATATFSVQPLVNFNGANTALTQNSGPAGTVTVLRTVGHGATGFGVQGLKADTTYNVNNGIIGATGSSTLGNAFTTTATGGIPIPGVQFTVPAGVTGIQTLTLVTGGVDALFGTCIGIIGYTCQATSSLTGNPAGQYGDMLFKESASILASPTVVNVGQAFTISGTGLTAGTIYEETLSLTQGAGNAVGEIYGFFTSSAQGSIPALTSVTMPPAATIAAGGCATATYPEQGTPFYVHLSTASEYPGAEDGEGQVVLAASMQLNMTSAPAGHAVNLVATGLGDGCTYDVIFNYGTNPAASAYTGTLVGAFTASALGSTPGSGVTISVPANAATGSTNEIQLTRLTGPALGVLSVAGSLTVGSVSTTSCNTTSCMTVSGTPATTTQGAYTGISSSFTNNSNAPVTAFVYAVVHNALGQTVDISTATSQRACRRKRHRHSTHSSVYHQEHTA